jgi:two-component system CheB/CheR fusion protein
VFVQDPATCEFDGMPRSALSTGPVDFKGPAHAMAAQLVANACPKPNPPDDTIPIAALDEAGVQKISALIRARTGHDFSLYKPGTIHRRIERRMSIHRLDRIEDYLRYLERNGAEVDALFGDLLIGVTQFFRDPAVFKQVEKIVVPRLLNPRSPGETVRVWVPGCSTGEEAYSIAILILERLAAEHSNRRIQIFATDIDPAAVARARAGVYPAGIAEHLTPKRLAHYFTAEPGGGYRIHKAVRDLLIFSEQDINRDPPFSQLDFISCRNLLIYLGGELQRKLIPLFHYALKPGGLLLLGPSEGAAEFAELFSPLDRRAKIYQRKGLPARTTATTPLRLAARPVRFDHVAPSGTVPLPPGGKGRPLRELTERLLLQQFAPAGVLVNRDGDILYVHGSTGLFLEPVAGEAEANNVLKMAREGLRRDLSTALRAAARTGRCVRCPNLRVKSHGHSAGVNLSVQPVAAERGKPSDTHAYLIVLESTPLPSAPRTAARSGRGATARRLADLQEE